MFINKLYINALLDQMMINFLYLYVLLLKIYQNMSKINAKSFIY